MLTQPQHCYTLQDYFELEASSEERYEYFDGEVFNMSGGTFEHEQIISNIIHHLRNKIGRRCRVIGSNIRLKVPSFPPYRYGDVAALCDEPQREKIGGFDVLINPALIVEVLSPSTESYDKSGKFEHCKSIASLTEYLLVSQFEPSVVRFTKQGNSVWQQQQFDNFDTNVLLSSLNCELNMSEIYEDVEFQRST